MKVARLTRTCLLTWGLGLPVLGLDLDGPQGRDIRPQDYVTWEALGAVADSAGHLVLETRLRLRGGFSLYESKLDVKGPPGFRWVSVSPEARDRLDDPIEGKEVTVYGEGDYRLHLEGIEPLKAPTVEAAITYVGCSEKICLLPATVTLQFAVTQSQEVLVPSTTPPAPPDLDQGEETDSLSETWAKRLRSGGGDTSGLATYAMVLGGGLLTNLTPCVYPMIPITLRVLSAQGVAPLWAAAHYALGILLSYSALGIFAAFTGSMFGSMLSSKPLNLFFALAMFAFAVSMLGGGNLGVLQQLGGRIGLSKPSARNAFLMGLGAGLVAAPCTGPILAALLTYTVQRSSPVDSIVMMVTYSLGFALPYLFLGHAAARLAKTKVPWQLQNTVKLGFAAAMAGLGFYYLRIPLYDFLHILDAVWPMLTATAGSAGVVLGVLWIVHPALQRSHRLSLVAAILLGVSIFSGTRWYIGSRGGQVDWIRSEAEAFSEAERLGRPLLIDAWAEWCEACKEMDRTTFRDEGVLELIESQWVPFKMDLTEDNPENTALQDKYELAGLPTLILLKEGASGRKMVKLEGTVGPRDLEDAMARFISE